MDPTVGVVVLTQGTRPQELTRAINSVLAQSGVQLDLVVVGNGWDPVNLPPEVRGLHLAENIGIPAGRNAGVPLVRGDFILFVDDDAELVGEDFLSSALQKFMMEPDLGIIQPRVQASSGESPTRWIPRIRKRSAAYSSEVFSLWEGVLVARRQAFEAAGGWGDEYFYAHEGIELAWRIWNQGYRVWYDGDLVCLHPPINPTRHKRYFELNARNRVWLARRNLPWILGIGYVASWTLIQLLRSVTSAENLKGLPSWWSGWWQGWRLNPGERKTLSWSTIATMTRLGRPPII